MIQTLANRKTDSLHSKIHTLRYRLEHQLAYYQKGPNKVLQKTSTYFCDTILENVHNNFAIIKEHKKIDKILNVTVDFIAEVITCIKDKDKKIISGDPEKIKKIYDTWVFSRDITSANPNWQLVNTLT